MEDRNYFENTEGRGVLATSDASGRVDAAVYARPHLTEDGLLAFVMTNRLTHANLHAAYLFMEDGPRYKGRRFFLTRVREESDPEVINSLKRRRYPREEEEKMQPLAAVFFKIDKELPLIGAGDD